MKLTSWSEVAISVRSRCSHLPPVRISKGPHKIHATSRHLSQCKPYSTCWPFSCFAHQGSNAAQYQVYWSSLGDQSIGRAYDDGSNVDPDFIHFTLPGEEAGNLSISGKYIYWTDIDQNTIGRANLDGSDVTLNFISAPGTWTPTGIATDSNYIYWSSLSDGTIGRANLDGTGVNRNFMDLSSLNGAPRQLSISGDYLYWRISTTNPSGKRVWTGRISTRCSSASLVPGLWSPSGIVAIPEPSVSLLGAFFVISLCVRRSRCGSISLRSQVPALPVHDRCGIRILTPAPDFICGLRLTP